MYEKKTIIGILASHDSVQKNNELLETIETLYGTNKELLEKFHFIFTGGTFNRLILEIDNEVRENEKIRHFSKNDICNFFAKNSTVLPEYKDGGIILLSYLVTQKICSILWLFLTPLTNHWLNPEDLALMRLCDVHRVKKLMNSGSVEEWFKTEAELDTFKNPQEYPIQFILKNSDTTLPILQKKIDRINCSYNSIQLLKEEFPDIKTKIDKVTIALIAHNEMKQRMIDFAIDYENELSKFKKIFTTGTTGTQILNSTNKLEDKINRYHSGPIGGDIEIASEILNNNCHVVIFFTDPLNPHPHSEDIRVILGACMRNNRVRMVGNELQAREWMERVVRVYINK